MSADEFVRAFAIIVSVFLFLPLGALLWIEVLERWQKFMELPRDK